MPLARLLSRYPVDNVPFVLRPLFALYGYGLGVLLYATLRLTTMMSRISIENPPPAGNYVFCTWHKSALLSFLIPRLSRTRHIWLNHADWYMKPIHVAGRFSGIERMVLGSTGDHGREAADEVVRALKDGCSTMMMPDGPYGPPGTMRKGALHMAAQSEVPIVGVSITCSRLLRLPMWDRKEWPLPFGCIRVCFGAPHVVRIDELSAVAEALRQDLGTC